MLDIRVSGRVTFCLSKDISDRFPAFGAVVRKDLEVPNPEFVAALRYKRYARRIPDRLYFYEWDAEARRLTVPRGYLPQLLEHLTRFGVDHEVIDETVEGPRVDFGSRIQLRDYQVGPVAAAVAAGGGIIEAPPGSGKTQMGLEVISRIGCRALWLTHTKDLAEQVIARAAAVLSIPAAEIGLVGAGREKVGEKLTVAIIQKLARMDLTALAQEFGLVLVDEVHRSPCTQWSAVIQQFPAHYRYGVTGTLARADGLETVAHLVIGPTVATVSNAEVEAAGGTVVPAMIRIPVEFRSEAWDAHEEVAERFRARGLEPPRVDYAAVQYEVLNNPARNRQITDTLASMCPGHSSLVLSERVDHCEELVWLLWTKAPDLRTAVISGRLGKTVRREILAKMLAGELDVLFAVDVAKEGLDIPRLDQLFLVAGGRNEVEVKQKVGRIQRACPGKAGAAVIDFVDVNIGLYKAQHYARRRVYKELGMAV